METASVSTLTWTATQTYKVELNGLEKLEASIREGTFKQPLNERWRVSLDFMDATESEPNPYFGVSLESTPVMAEYHDLNNLWCRNLNWGASLQTKGGVFLRKSNMTPDTYGVYSNGDKTLKVGWRNYLTWEQVFAHPSVVEDDSFVLVFSLEEDMKVADLRKPHSDHWRQKLSESLAKQLLDPENGDVVFLVTEDCAHAPLYAWRHVLAAASEYFSTRFSPTWAQSIHNADLPHTSANDDAKPDIQAAPAGDRRPNPSGALPLAVVKGSSSTKRLVFGEFKQHSPPDSDKECTSLAPSDIATEPNVDERPEKDDRGRQIVYISDFDFITMHNLLYFLYTGCVNLHENPELPRGDLEEHPDGYPDKVDAFLLYRAANMYLMEELEDRCYRYLVATCSAENVCERLFGDVACGLYHKLKDAYFGYVVQNYDTIKMSKGWAEMLRNLKDCSPELLEYRSEILLDLSKLTFGAQ